jgi:hypothetical protein
MPNTAWHLFWYARTRILLTKEKQMFECTSGEMLSTLLARSMEFPAMLGNEGISKPVIVPGRIETLPQSTPFVAHYSLAYSAFPGNGSNSTLFSSLPFCGVVQTSPIRPRESIFHNLHITEGAMRRR